MAPKHRIIIDTDPGVDDTLALLLALSAHPDDLTIELISVTFGNVPVQTCLRNVVTLFHQIGREMAWRKSVGRSEGFEALRRERLPLVAVGAEGPLADQLVMADYFHGVDGLAAKDTETFLKAKDVIVMGGALRCPGNVTPVAEFNTYADSMAAARIYALTSRYPRTTMPPVPPTRDGKVASNHLGPYPDKLSRRLHTTTEHWLRRGVYNKTIKPFLDAGSPLAAWTNAFLTSTFNKMESLHEGHAGDGTGLSLHDPLCIWYLLTLCHSEYAMTLSEPQDLRVETSGQWTRGMYVLDRRDRFKKVVREEDMMEELDEVIGDAGRWLDGKSGNRILVAQGSGGKEVMGREMLRWILET
ncbi:hypothetical protein FKW77_006363 [Venturia effusa]|uniref:Inosine/uridine-preferring nucleoside hydrolase domain-containing protein n=1 Tax=Venturia effusa TaxID=50376 RepID=A0A517LFN2_9PEZI|nr:hypothetical protein FKW77_006363 [Venturia effusa]